jgi:hypothetical protein
MQSALEKLVGVFEPAIYTRTADPAGNGEGYIVYRSLTTRGDYLDGYEEIEYPHGFASACFSDFITNGCMMALCLTGVMEVAHNGTIAGLHDGEEVYPVLMWPTNRSPIWCRNTMIVPEGAPLAAIYNAYLDAGRTFPWQTNAGGTQ